MQIKLYEEAKKSGEIGRIMIVLDDPGADLAAFVKQYVTSLGAKQTVVNTVAPERPAEAVPEVPADKPVAEAETNGLFPGAPIPAPVKEVVKKDAAKPADPKPAPKQEAAPKSDTKPAPKQEPTKKAAEPKPAPKQEPTPAPAPEPAEEGNILEEIRELWELLDEDTQEEYLANFGAGTLEDIEEDSLPVLLDMLNETL